MQAHTAKVKKYGDLCTARGLVLTPFICGSLGGYTDDTVCFLKQLGTALSCTTSLTREQAISDVYRRVSFAVQKAQAMAILNLGELAGVLSYDESRRGSRRSDF